MNKQTNRVNPVLTGGSHTTIAQLAIMLCLLLSSVALGDEFTPLPWGEDSVAGRCVVCHSLEKGGEFRVAPNLWGIVDAEKARDRSWYAYSPGLVRSGGTWTEKDLDLYLANASEFIPGTSKSIRVPDAGERQDIIEFLGPLSD